MKTSFSLNLPCLFLLAAVMLSSCAEKTDKDRLVGKWQLEATDTWREDSSGQRLAPNETFASLLTQNIGNLTYKLKDDGTLIISGARDEPLEGVWQLEQKELTFRKAEDGPDLEASEGENLTRTLEKVSQDSLVLTIRSDLPASDHAIQYTFVRQKQ